MIRLNLTAAPQWLGFAPGLRLLVAERLSTSERTHEIQRRMLDAASRRPRSRDNLLDRLRGGEF